MFKRNVFQLYFRIGCAGVELFLSMLYFNTKKSIVAIVLGVDQTANWRVKVGHGWLGLNSKHKGKSSVWNNSYLLDVPLIVYHFPAYLVNFYH